MTDAKNLLLDTCAIIWVANRNPVSQAAIEAIDAASQAGTLRISPMSAWEIGMLMAYGRLRASLSPEKFMQNFTDMTGAEYCDLSASILIDSSYLPGAVHGDPADRIILATARQFGLSVVTRDRAMLAYAKDGHISAVAC